VLNKKNCLKKKKDFEQVIKKGKKIEKAFLVLKFFENSLKETTRVGFVVSQKISKKASLRNQIKRRLREIVKNNLITLKPGYDLIFFTKRGIKEKDFLEMEKVVKQILEQADLKKDIE
jgi:ribonuclease P protein component